MSERQIVSQEIRRNSQIQNRYTSDENEEQNKLMRNLEDLQKDLVQAKIKLNDASIRCHKLNIDVATMFNPETLASLETYREQCDICLARMSQTLNEPLEDVTDRNEKRSPTEE